ncbi:uncharacterized protein LOC108035696 [Drosophila biarmipes]|uniref:uncharacterized protein LOC108035696 n=1 Tax=Drosophila biarmipes TaxID=125945 RepID=UPI0007E71959|nr:uncharacterized protein LOC108035696 [Drosophila biarmipes]
MGTKTLVSEYVEIHPKNEYLSAKELIAHRHSEFEPQSGGLKRTQNEGTAQELEELRRAQEQLRAQLSVPRIERLGGRALAIWNEEQQVAEVLRKDGKFENFGYSDQGKLYLEYYEAMFLLELGRLQLEYYGSVVSIEQAYVLLFGELESEKYSNYLVYSALSRAGYIVVRHKPPKETPEEVTSADCVWALLKEKVGNQPVPEHIKTSSFYSTVQKQMEHIKELITSQKTEDPKITESIDFKFDSRKRKADEKPIEEPASKKEKLSKTGRSLVDQLKDELSYSKFEEIFEEFDIIQLKSQEDAKEEITEPPTLKISFDLHLHNEGFKKSSPKPPNFNVVILPSQTAFPTHDEIAKMQTHQTAPLLVISVSESKQIQAFLYYIS